MNTKLFLILLTGLSFLTAKGEKAPYNIFRQANESYAQSRFAEAEKLYKQIREKGYEAPELYYNLGNACYRQKKYTDAIYYYEKAALQAPADNDIRHNLSFAKLSIHKQLQESPDFFFSRLYKNILDCCASEVWAKAALIFFAIMLASILLYLFSRRRKQKIIGFSLASLFFVVSLLAFVFSQKRLKTEKGNSQAIVFTEALPLRSSPNETATVLIRISAGHKVDIRDRSGEWTEIKLSNGQVGWVEKSDIKRL